MDITENDEKQMLDHSVTDFVTATAAKSPTPGGGSVAGVVGALGTALGEMALNFTRGKKTFADHEADYEAIAARLGKSREMFCALIAEDIAAYSLYQQATRAEGPDKPAQEQLALAAAIDVPREMAKLALAVLADFDSLLNRCNKWLLTDLAAGAVLAEPRVVLSAATCTSESIASRTPPPTWAGARDAAARSSPAWVPTAWTRGFFARGEGGRVAY